MTLNTDYLQRCIHTLESSLDMLIEAVLREKFGDGAT